MKCQICKDEEAKWAWQPFGPNETPDSYTLLGSHYRGFPLIKVGHTCKLAFQTGDFPVEFEYKGHRFIGKDHEVREVLVRLWAGESYNSSDFPNFPAHAIMRDTATKGIDVVALVFDDNLEGRPGDLFPVFIAAPELLEACEEVDKLRDKVEFHLQAAMSRGYVADDTLKAVLMALAKVSLALKAAQGEENEDSAAHSYSH